QVELLVLKDVDASETKDARTGTVPGKGTERSRHGAGTLPAGSVRARSDAADRILLHPVWGLAVFLLAMFVIFTSIFWLATPFMDAIDAAFGWGIAGLKRVLPDSWVVDMLADGVVG